MKGDRLDSDRTIRDLREDIDGIDAVRATKMASWIIATIENLDYLESGEMDRRQITQHWAPYNTIILLTRRRDRRTDQVGNRKKELEEIEGEPIAVNQEGRWQSVKLTYLQAIAEACEDRRVSMSDSYTAFEWMHDYTEYEHNRAKHRQSSRRSEVETSPKPDEVQPVVSLAPVPPEKHRLGFLHLLNHHKTPEDRRTA